MSDNTPFHVGDRVFVSLDNCEGTVVAVDDGAFRSVQVRLDIPTHHGHALWYEAGELAPAALMYTSGKALHGNV